MVVMGFLVLIGVACSAENKPLDPPFESLIPKCEYFAPLFDSAKASSWAALDPPSALRRCSGNLIELRMRLKKFSDSAESSRYLEELAKFWNEPGRQVKQHDYSERDAHSTRLRNDFYLFQPAKSNLGVQLDGYFEVDMGFYADCVLGNDRFAYGPALVTYFRVGNFVGEYELENCDVQEKHWKDGWPDFDELAVRLDLVNFSRRSRLLYSGDVPSFEEQILKEIAIHETGLRIRRLID
jgi:hypothetical protein